MTFQFTNVEVLRDGNKKTVRKVTIKNNKGSKSVTKYINGKHKKTVKRNLKRKEISHIRKKKFIPELFDNCKCII